MFRDTGLVKISVRVRVNKLGSEVLHQRRDNIHLTTKITVLFVCLSDCDQFMTSFTNSATAPIKLMSSHALT